MMKDARYEIYLMEMAQLEILTFEQLLEVAIQNKINVDNKTCKYDLLNHIVSIIAERKTS